MLRVNLRVILLKFFDNLEDYCHWLHLICLILKAFVIQVIHALILRVNPPPYCESSGILQGTFIRLQGLEGFRKSCEIPCDLHVTLSGIGYPYIGSKIIQRIWSFSMILNILGNQSCLITFMHLFRHIWKPWSSLKIFFAYFADFNDPEDPCDPN